ncbi:hypothetical protein [Streptomyces sp. NPDC101455]|uniref:hypothetical protein n=1 Tax=Streptomyces sp. NPDC101455 TaxID=3366142 RepID=UPI0037FC7347
MSDDDLTIHDVMSGDEIAEYDRDAEFRMDAADEERALKADAEDAARAAESGDDPDDCGGEFIDGTWYGCGVCPACLSTADNVDEDDLVEEWA